MDQSTFNLLMQVNQVAVIEWERVYRNQYGALPSDLTVEIERAKRVRFSDRRTWDVITDDI